MVGIFYLRLSKIASSAIYVICRCHVMEHESFENESTAKILNDNYVSIKVDREERPDVDKVYVSISTYN